MEKYCHFIAIYTLLSTSIFFRVGNLLFLSLPKCLSPLNPWPASSLATPGWLAEGGGGLGWENTLSCFCDGVCSAGVVWGGRVYLSSPSSGVGSRTFYYRGPATFCFTFLCFDHYFFWGGAGKRCDFSFLLVYLIACDRFPLCAFLVGDVVVV